MQLGDTTITQTYNFSCAFIDETNTLSAHDYALQVTVRNTGDESVRFEALAELCRLACPNNTFIYYKDDYQSALAANYLCCKKLRLDYPVSAEILLNYISESLLSMFKSQLKTSILVNTKLREGSNSYVVWKPYINS